MRPTTIGHDHLLGAVFAVSPGASAQPRPATGKVQTVLGPSTFLHDPRFADPWAASPK